MGIFHFGKHKGTVSLTITGLFLAWIIGAIFMPKSCKSESKENLTGLWICRTDSGFTEMKITGSGDFYFDVWTKNKSTLKSRGITSTTLKDTFLLISFNKDTLLYHTIITLDKTKLTLKSIKNGSFISFDKQ